jgi:hypothetical protein
MKKLLTSPSKMPLSEAEASLYQNVLKQIPEVSLNLMAVKVTNHPQDFVGWCLELIDVCKKRINFDLLEPAQLPVLRKIQQYLETGVSLSQLRTLRIAPWAVIAQTLEHSQTQLVLSEQLALANFIATLRDKPLAHMSKEDRLAFAGKHTQAHDPAVYSFDVEWFASTKAAKSFHQLLETSCTELDEALAEIPLTGDVEYKHYQAFIARYIAAFAIIEDETATLAPATRLLAMRRPDVFTPITSSSLDLLAQALSVTRLNNRDFDRYWHDIVMAIHKQPWFVQATDASEFEARILPFKALVPCWFTYYGDDAELQSNYYKLVNKPKRNAQSNSTQVARKRSKESAESLVNKALAHDDIPAHIRNLRDSIVSEVEKGRSVDETIALMRTIFG